MWRSAALCALLLTGCARAGPALSGLLPACGTVGTPIYLLGAGLSGVPGAKPRCRVGRAVVDAQLVSAAGPGSSSSGEALDVLLCPPPPYAPVGFASVEVSLNGRDFTRSGLVFEYVEFLVHATWPVVASTEGGTLLTVHAESLRQGMACSLFGEDAGLAGLSQFVSTALMRCELPQQQWAGMAALSVAPPGAPLGAWPPTSLPQEVALASLAAGGGGSNPLLLRFADPPLVTTAKPASPGMALVQGSGFSAAFDGIWCRVGTFGPLAAQWLSPTRVHCPLPLLGAEPQALAVRVSNDGSEFSHDAAMLQIDAALPSLVLWPETASVQGGSEVTLFGDFSAASGALSDSHLRCALPDSLSSVTCTVLSASHAGFVALSLQLGDQHGALQISYQEPPSIVGVRPTLAGARGGQLLWLSARGLSPQSDLGGCSLDGDAPGPPAHIVSSALAACETMPASAQGRSVLLELTSNGQPPADGFFLILEPLEPPRIRALQPSRGPSRGGSPVRVLGAGFFKQSAHNCRFGTLQVSAKWVSEAEVQCVAPAHLPGAAAVQLALSSLDWSPPGGFVFYGS